MNLLQKLRQFNPTIEKNELLSSKLYLEDREHGMVHSFMVLFWASLHSELTDRLIRSCLFHDYLRVTLKIEPHDKLLTNLSLDLEEITYFHSHPPSNYENHPLIIGDRIELLRYNDYEDWLKFECINTYINIDELKTFYQETDIEEIVKGKWNVIGRS